MNGKPLLLVFGPQYFDASQWKQLRTVLQPTTLILGLPHLSKLNGLDGPYGWPPVHGGKEITSGTWQGYIRELGQRADAGEPTVAIAFPGFKDIYKEAGLHDSYGYIDARNGRTLTETLELADASKAGVIQVATWNDYGEGTIIEPTKLDGYSRLETVSRFCGTRYSRADLQLPADVYLARVKSGSAADTAELNAVAQLLLEGKAKSAATRFLAWKSVGRRGQD